MSTNYVHQINILTWTGVISFTTFKLNEWTGTTGLTDDVNYMTSQAERRLMTSISLMRCRCDSEIFSDYAGVTLSRFWLPMDTRWRKFATSGMIVKTSGHSGLHPKPSCDRRLRFLGFGSNFGSAHKIFGMSKNCRRSSRRCSFV